ncbi:MAG: shikimate dehydrogenase [Chloroflexi bacterium]|nr:shikimate dehydrogenase [Chloroflexota bacterium]
MRSPAHWATALRSLARTASRSPTPASGATSNASSSRERSVLSHRWACLLGQPVGHSLSPALHNAAFAALGLDAHYEAREVSVTELSGAVDALRAADCMGANVTAPHKQAAVALMDELSDEVVALGALNTIVNQSGRLIGANTDARGLAHWMRLVGIDPTRRPALVLGAGGAARATVWALANLGANRVRVLNRTAEHVEELVLALRPRLSGVELTWGHLDEAAEPPSAPWRVIVNATSLGHHGRAPMVHPGCYSPACVAIELAYNPPETGFMRAAREAGARAENGLGMLLHQAALAFERWTGQAPPMDVFAAALTERVGR